MSSRNRCRRSRNPGFETFESRIVMTADPVFGSFSDAQFQAELAAADQALEQSLDEVHRTTGSDYVHQQYEFDGAGQTVAIIDSGIAWDHYALGEGFGEGYQVVGGWDFAENDANPYDDGPAGFHGTHVAGIVGSRDAINRGVAAGVNFVGLRVFDDSGHGNLEWVEQALQWVHDHRDAFVNPITTVNLSLGVDWNANTLPNWATLENELEQLEADGIFVSVAAGNAFQNYLQPGLSYPAVSDHVVPVASHDGEGNLSDFSQRNGRVVVAPGESIRSSVPDHLFGGSRTDQFLAASGTSMAAPYLSGASAVLRQAMEFMGQEQIDQWTLYNHFRQTANQFFDAVTGRSYSRLDLGKAVDAVVTDTHGNHARAATDLGIIQDHTSFSGVIGKRDDADHFRFGANQSGTVTLNINQTHELDAVVRINGSRLDAVDGRVSFDVRAGGQYSLAITTANGIGHYSVDSDFQASVPARDLGMVASFEATNQSVDGAGWYRVTAARDGILTVQADAEVNLQIYDAGMNQLAAGNGQGTGSVRVDASVSFQSDYYIRVGGNSESFALQFNNQVALDDGQLRIFGTFQDDEIGIDTRHGVTVTVDSVDYHFSTSAVDQVQVNAFSGRDNINVHLGGTHDQITMFGQSVTVVNQQFSIAAHHVESIFVSAGDGQDRATFEDNASQDVFVATSQYAKRFGGGTYHHVFGVEHVTALSSSGADTAWLFGSHQSDHVFASANRTTVSGDGRAVSVLGFDQVQVDALGGQDTAFIQGSEGNDQLVMTGRTTRLTSDGAVIHTAGIEKHVADGGAGFDRVRFYDTGGDDHYSARSGWSVMRAGGYLNSANGFEVEQAIVVHGGADRAVLYGTSATERLTGDRSAITLKGSGFEFSAQGFQQVTAMGSGGHDHVNFVGSAGRDWMYATEASTWVWGSTWRTAFHGFEQVAISGNGGFDTAVLLGGVSNTNFAVDELAAEMVHGNRRTVASGFEGISLDGGGGSNALSLDGFANGNRITASGSALLAYLDEVRVDAANFVWMEARTADGETAVEEISAVDFWYALHGRWD